MGDGIVFNIQHYAIHDGPGIRTMVFLKGCPMDCWWCHNPESQGYRQQILFRRDRCIGCGDCLEVCGSKEIGRLKEGNIQCMTGCGMCEKCIDICPTEALELVGRRMSAVDVMTEVEKDQIFYEQSGGGVTFSGGEPLSQVEFLAELLEACKRRGIHTAIDTSGYSQWESIMKVVDKVDLFLYDLKLMDENRHQQYTGVSNGIVLENLRRIAKQDKNIWIRIPMIPGVNDDEENVQQTGEFLSSLNIQNIFLLPYHKIAMDKYERLGKGYKLPLVEPPVDKDLHEISERLKKFGLHVKIGG